MGVKKKAAEHGDRVQWGERTGTIISLHANKDGKSHGPNFGVLPDDGPARLHNWPKVECVVLDDRPATCPRCGVAGHRAQQCQTEYLAWKKKERSSPLVQQPSPQPHQGWDVDF